MKTNMKIDNLVKLLEEIAHSAASWHDVGTALRKQDLNTPEHPLWKYVFAFEYMHVEDTNKDYFDRYGIYAPWIEIQGRVFPPPLDTLGNEVFAEWEIVLGKSSSPVICSRLSDLLWVRRWGDKPHRFARQAIDAFFKVADGGWIEIESTFCLIRALDLSKEINDGNRKNIASSRIVESARKSMDSDNPKPGITLRLLESLMKFSTSEISGDIDSLLELAMVKYANNVWIIENIIDLMIKRAEGEKRKELQRNQVSRWVEEAEKNEKGIMRLSYLEHALELARNYGFQDLADEIRIRIQSIPDESLGMQDVAVQTEIPREKFEKYLNWFIDERGWKESFTRFGWYGPPSGDYKNNIEEVEKQFKESPLLFLVTRAVYDENNAPIRLGRNIEDNKDIALANYETLGIRLFGTSAPEILKRIITRHGIPPIEELIEFFTTPLISRDISENIAKAIVWYFDDEFDIASHLIIPRIENVFRIISRGIGLPIIREPIGDKPGGVLQLGTLLTMLTGKINESWRRYFYNLLVNPIGVNLRNRICHGLVPRVGKDDAALLIHVVCNLRLIRLVERDT